MCLMLYKIGFYGFDLPSILLLPCLSAPATMQKDSKRITNMCKKIPGSPASPCDILDQVMIVVLLDPAWLPRQQKGARRPLSYYILFLVSRPMKHTICQVAHQIAITSISIGHPTRSLSQFAPALSVDRTYLEAFVACSVTT
jgi:hypothetical protein